MKVFVASRDLLRQIETVWRTQGEFDRADITRQRADVLDAKILAKDTTDILRCQVPNPKNIPQLVPREIEWLQ